MTDTYLIMMNSRQNTCSESLDLLCMLSIVLVIIIRVNALPFRSTSSLRGGWHDGGDGTGGDGTGGRG